MSKLEAVEAVINLIELGGVAPEHIVKVLRSALDNAKDEPRQWQGLTPARLVCLWRESNGDESGGVERFARAIEQALREKNGGGA